MLFKVILHFVAAWFAPKAASAQLYDTTGFRTVTHSTSAPVTAPSGAQSVSLSGGATYSVPLQVAPGTGGMQPTLAATYNSQSGVTTMGLGWSIAGAGSAISRSNKTFAQDGWAGAPTLANADALVLDGQRLICVSASNTYGANGSIYTTENEAYSRITLVGALSSPTAYFVLVTKQGMTIEYDNDANKLVWCANRYDQCFYTRC